MFVAVVYMDEEVSTAFQEKVSGEYVGIGTEIIQYEDSKIEVKNVYETGPAYKSGIRSGDILIKVNDIEIKDKTLSEISSMVKGKAGTVVKITVLRDGEELSFDVKRQNIDITSVYGEIIDYNDSKIGYMAVSIFASNTKDQFAAELKERGIAQLV